MPTFGGYETVRQLHRHGLATVFLAKAAGDGEARFVVKVFRPALRLSDRQSTRRAAAMFLDQAELQRRTAVTGGYWARIHAQGDGGARGTAYYVTDWYPRSIEKLAFTHTRLSARGLHSIISGVVQGLIELKRTCRRAHANLKPSNILIGGGRLEKAAVVLADPAAADSYRLLNDETDETMDLIAVGGLIHQLVVHEPVPATQAGPISPSPEWRVLGSLGDGWRDLCGRLLEPNALAPLTLQGVEAELRRLRVRRGLSPAQSAACAGIVAAAAAGALATVQYRSFARDWREFCLDNDQWLYRFQVDLKSDPARLREIENDPQLRKSVDDVLAQGEDLDPKHISGNETTLLADLAEHPPISWAAYSRTGPALEKIRRLRKSLSPEQWDLLKKVTDNEQRYRQRGWIAAAEYLRGLANGVRPQPGVQLATGIDRLISLNQKTLTEDLDSIEDVWQSIAETSKAIAATAPQDKILGQFDDFVRRYCTASPKPESREGHDLHKLADAIKPLKKLAGDLGDVLKLDWPTRLDHQRFAAESAVYKTDSVADAAVFQQWLGSEPDYCRIHLNGSSEQVAALNAMAEEVRKEIETLPDTFDDHSTVEAELHHRLDAINAQVEAFKNKPWVAIDSRTDRIAADASVLQTALKDLKQQVWVQISSHTVDQKTWYERLQKESLSDSPTIAATWKQWIGNLNIKGDGSSIGPSDFVELRRNAERWKTALALLDKKVRPAPTPAEPYLSIAQRKREQELHAAIDAMPPWSDGKPNLDVLTREGDRRAGEYAKWCKDLDPFLDDFTQASSMLDAAYAPEESSANGVMLGQVEAKWKSAEVFTDLQGQPMVAGVLQRLSALAALRTASRQELADAATRADGRPELILSSWRRLGTSGISPDWPADAGELRLELAARERLKAVIDSLKDQFRQKQLSGEVHDAGPVRLAKFLMTPRRADEIEAALAAASAAAGPLGISVDEGDPFSLYQSLADSLALDGPHRFDLLLFGLRQTAALSGADDEQISRAYEHFRAAAEKLPENTRSQASVVNFLHQLETLDQPEPRPGPAEWKYQADSTTGLVTLSSGDGGAGSRLQFAAVHLPHARPVYLCTTEVCFADFVAVTHGLPEVQQTLLKHVGPGDDARLGPRVWDWTGAGILTQPEQWLRPFTGEASVGGGGIASSSSQPSPLGSPGGSPARRPRLPMNYLPAPTAIYLAARFGCRLPTPAEWAAAYEMQRLHGSSPFSGHLRGTAFKAQRDLVAARKSAYPDADIFWPRTYVPKKTGRDAEVYAKDDDTLWFRDVDDDGAVFHHLEGNVAEYVWDDPAGVDRFANKELSKIASMIQRSSGKLFVIGGSALSAPELPTTEPLAVDVQRWDFPSVWTGFADVGMRLAFPAPATNDAERLGWVLSEQSYLSSAPPRPATGASALAPE